MASEATALAARTGVCVDRYVALIESASKGSFLAAMTEQFITIVKGSAPAQPKDQRPLSLEPKGGRTVGSPAMTLNDMMKVKGDDGCDFAVVPRS